MSSEYNDVRSRGQSCWLHGSVSVVVMALGWLIQGNDSSCTSSGPQQKLCAPGIRADSLVQPGHGPELETWKSSM